MHALKKETIARIETLAAKEHRTFEGQLLAMSDLYERTYKIKSDQIQKRRGRPPKAIVTQPELQVKVKPEVKAQPKRRGGRQPGSTHSPEVRQKISTALKGKPKSEAWKRALSFSLKLTHARKKLAKMQAELAQAE
jgi:hypothetical protein